MSLLGVLSACLCCGCGGGENAEVPQAEVESNIQHLAVLYGRYTATHRGQPPKSADEFKAFVKGLDQAELSALGVQDASGLFTSPRDNQPYVIVTGTHAAAGPDAPIVIYEQTGAGGTRFVADSLGAYREVDNSEFEQIKPK